MKHFFTKLLFIAVAFIWGYGEVNAFNVVYFRSSITSWDSTEPITNESHDGTEIFSTEFNLEHGNTIEFKFFVVDEYYGSNYGWLGAEDGASSSMSLNTNYWGSKKYDKNFRFTATNDFSRYKVTLTFHDHGGDTQGYWLIMITGLRTKTLELRDYYDVKYNGTTRNITGRGNYKYFCTWSDQTVWRKPSNVDVFAMSDYTAATEDAKARVTLTKLDLDYIPANMGLILATQTNSDGIVLERGADGNSTTFNLLRKQLIIYSDQTASYSGSLLKTCYDATALPRFETVGETEYANYLFGFYRSTKVGIPEAAENDFALGFWLSNGSGNTYANSAYLQIPKAEAELMGVGTSYDFTESSSAAPCFLLDFGEFDDATPTGIHEVSSLKGKGQKNNDEGLWYTLDGRKVLTSHSSLPKGIYIRNGKKYIIK